MGVAREDIIASLEYWGPTTAHRLAGILSAPMIDVYDVLIELNKEGEVNYNRETGQFSV